jgi:hypothetical protein
VLSVPLLLEPGSQAAITLLTEKTNNFTAEFLEQVMAFSATAASSYILAAQVRSALGTAGHLRAAMQSRTSIDVACGVIMGQNRCSYEHAFAILTKASSHRNIKTRVVAEAILKDLPGGAPPTHFNA